MIFVVKERETTGGYYKVIIIRPGEKEGPTVAYCKEKGYAEKVCFALNSTLQYW